MVPAIHKHNNPDKEWRKEKDQSTHRRNPMMRLPQAEEDGCGDHHTAQIQEGLNHAASHSGLGGAPTRVHRDLGMSPNK